MQRITLLMQQQSYVDENDNNLLQSLDAKDMQDNSFLDSGQPRKSVSINAKVKMNDHKKYPVTPFVNDKTKSIDISESLDIAEPDELLLENSQNIITSFVQIINSHDELLKRHEQKLEEIEQQISSITEYDSSNQNIVWLEINGQKLKIEPELMQKAYGLFDEQKNIYNSKGKPINLNKKDVSILQHKDEEIDIYGVQQYSKINTNNSIECQNDYVQDISKIITQNGSKIINQLQNNQVQITLECEDNNQMEQILQFKTNNKQMNDEQMNKEQMNNDQMNYEQMNNEQMNNEQMNKEQMNNEQMNNQQLNDEQMNNEQMNNQQLNDEQMNNEQMNNQQLNDEQMNNEQMNNQQLNDEQMNNQQMNTEQMNTEQMNNELVSNQQIQNNNYKSNYNSDIKISQNSLIDNQKAVSNNIYEQMENNQDLFQNSQQTLNEFKLSKQQNQNNINQEDLNLFIDSSSHYGFQKSSQRLQEHSTIGSDDQIIEESFITRSSVKKLNSVYNEKIKQCLFEKEQEVDSNQLSYPFDTQLLPQVSIINITDSCQDKSFKKLINKDIQIRNSDCFEDKDSYEIKNSQQDIGFQKQSEINEVGKISDDQDNFSQEQHKQSNKNKDYILNSDNTLQYNKENVVNNFQNDEMNIDNIEINKKLNLKKKVANFINVNIQNVKKLHENKNISKTIQNVRKLASNNLKNFHIK